MRRRALHKYNIPSSTACHPEGAPQRGEGVFLLSSIGGVPTGQRIEVRRDLNLFRVMQVSMRRP